jgi:hypothetical protein
LPSSSYDAHPVTHRRGDAFDDDHPTMAMDREARDVMPGGGRARLPAAGAPIPNFRPPPGDAPTLVRAGMPAPPTFGRAPPMPFGAATPPPWAQVARGASPYALWIVASVMAAIASYFAAPAVVAKIETSSQTSRR